MPLVKTLLLVDGSGYLYRAYHALPDLRTAQGEPTGALRGFLSMLRNLREIVPADYFACVFDAKGPTFRDAIFPEYKAHRPPMPADLASQTPVVREAVAALGWTVLRVSGVEADDVMATLARQAADNGLRAVIATGDKDLAQLVDDSIGLIDTMRRDGGPVRHVDRAAVIERFGVPPERIVDYLALVGDAVDNVPGVDKVGPKTAVKWLQQYGSLDGVIAHADGIGGAVGVNLRKVLEWLPTARALVTVRTDVDLREAVPSLDGLALRPPDQDVLRRIYERAEFRSWLREIPGLGLPGLPALPAESGGMPSAPRSVLHTFGSADSAGSADPADPARTPAAAAALPPPTYECVRTEEQLAHWLHAIEHAELTSIDTETTSLDPMRAEIVGISLAVRAGEACYIPLGHRDMAADAAQQLDRAMVLARLRPWLESDEHAKLGQHAKYDAHVFANAGLRLAGIAHDTMLQSYVLEAHRSRDMDSLAARHLGRKTISYEEVCGKGAKQIGFDLVPIDRATEYAAEDAEVTLALHQTLWPRIEADADLRRIYETIEIPVSRVLFRMERNGVRIDPLRLQEQSREIGLRIAALEAEAFTLAGGPFNLASTKQVAEVLFERLQLPVVKKTAGGAPSTDEEVLEKLARDYPLPQRLLEHRGLSKLRSTYCDKLPAMIHPVTGRVHTTYGQAVAVTGRLSSSDPNLQNIPIRTADGRRIRAAFVAPPGSRILSADYSQIELRIMAHICGDPGLVGAFERGEDVHRRTASEVFGIPPEEVDNDQRRVAKTINFGLIYGMSAFGLASSLGIGRDAAQRYIERYFQRYPGVAQYMEATRATARQQGYVQTVFGRRLWLPEIQGANGPRRQAAERAAINAPMQGTAADLIKLAMIRVDEWLTREGMKTCLVMQVHDELVLEVPEDEEERVRAAIPGLMTGVAQWQVPLEVEVGVGSNWDEAH